MNILAIADKFIEKDIMEKGLKLFKENGHTLVVREWHHKDIEALQYDNLIIEQKGANAIELPNDLISDVENYDLIIVQFAPIGKEVIKKANKLKYIGVLRGGIENVDIDEAKNRGIEVLNTAGRNARAVAEFTVGMILSEIRNIARAHSSLKNGIFRKDFPNSSSIPELLNKKIGIVGFGAVGQLVYKFLSSFGCQFIIYEPYLKELPVNEKKVELEELLKESDIVTIHMRLTDKTYHMIDDKELRLMKKEAYLINTARSGLVNQSSVVNALKENRLMGAAIDVFDNEPIPKDDPILKLDNLTITTHLAGSTKDAFTNTPILFTEIFLKKYS